MSRKAANSRRAELRRSLRNPHPESLAFHDPGFDEWTRCLPEEDTATLLDERAGQPVRWKPVKGWRGDSSLSVPRSR